MPRYDLICDNCKQVQHDVDEPMSYNGPRVCPDCDGPMHRMMPLTQPPQGGDTPKHHRRS